MIKIKKLSKKRRSKLKQFFIASSLILIIVGYQNCGGLRAYTKLLSSSSLSLAALPATCETYSQFTLEKPDCENYFKTLYPGANNIQNTDQLCEAITITGSGLTPLSCFRPAPAKCSYFGWLAICTPAQAPYGCDPQIVSLPAGNLACFKPKPPPTGPYTFTAPTGDCPVSGNFVVAGQTYCKRTVTGTCGYVGGCTGPSTQDYFVSSWSVGSFGSCSGGCGTSGTQTRSIVATAYVTSPNGAPKPAATQNCSNPPCPTPEPCPGPSDPDGQERVCQEANGSWHRAWWSPCNQCNADTRGMSCRSYAGEGRCGSCFFEHTCP